MVEPSIFLQLTQEDNNSNADSSNNINNNDAFC